MLLDVAEVDVLADRVVGVQGDRAGGVVLGAVRILGLGQLGELAGLGDLDRVGSGVEAGEGVVAVRVGLGGGDDTAVGATSSTVMSLKGSSPLSNEEDSFAS